MFEKHKKPLEKAGYIVYDDKVTGPKGDVVADINPYGQLETKDPEVLSILKKPVKSKKKVVDGDE